MNERFDDLMFRQLRGALRTGEKEELASMLDGDPAARREFVLFMEQQTDIAECLAVKSAVTALRQPLPRSLPVLRQRSHSPFLAMAALLALMATVVGLLHFREIANGRTPVVTRVSGSVDRAAGALRPGESVSTGAESSAMLTYPDGTVVELAAETTLRVPTRSWSDRSKGLDLVTGRIAADVMPQLTGSPMILSSADVSAEVVGTKLVFQHDDLGTRLEVTEGAVRFIPLEGGEALLVKPGVFAESGKSGVRSGAIKASTRLGIVRFTLMNADSDEPLREAALSQGETISLGSLPTRNINIRADYEGEAPTSVRLHVTRHDGQETGVSLSTAADQTHPPFFVAGDYWPDGRPNDCRAWTPRPGRYHISAAAIYGDEAGGDPGKPLEMDFQIAE